MFFTEGQIHWRFHTIAGLDFSNQPVGKPKGQGSFWRMAPRKGQGYYQSKNLGFNVTWENWIVASLKLPKVKTKANLSEKISAKKEKIDRAAGSSSAEISLRTKFSSELEGKLQVLKNLLEQDLIDDLEYKRKRKELLDHYL